MEFEWDQEKADSNLRSHGVPFEAAARVFLDPCRIEEDDPYPDEERQRTIGSVDDRLLFVVFTMRDDVCRIISARFAGPKERRRYHESG